jgi:ribose transport system substrate-binding protein
MAMLSAEGRVVVGRRRSRRVMRRALAAAACVVGLAGLAACGDDGGGASAAKGQGEQFKIAFFTDSLDNAYLQAGVAAAKDVAAKRGAQLDVISAGWDPNKQLTQVEDAVTSGRYDALVVESIDGNTLCKTLTRAAKTMVVSIYNAPICGHFKDLYTPGTVGFFGRDEYRSGQHLAEQMAKAIGGEGTVGYVSGPVQVGIVKTTTEGIKDKLAEYPGIQLVAQLDGAWDPAKGLAATQDLVQSHPDVDGIIYGVDQMAVPSLDWLRRSGNLGDRKIVTLGGTREGFQLIEKGDIHASVNSLPREEAAYGVQAAIDALEKKPIDVPGWDAKRKVYDVLQDPNQPPIVNDGNVGEVEAEWHV